MTDQGVNNSDDWEAYVTMEAPYQAQGFSTLLCNTQPLTITNPTQITCPSPSVTGLLSPQIHSVASYGSIPTEYFLQSTSNYSFTPRSMLTTIATPRMQYDSSMDTQNTTPLSTLTTTNGCPGPPIITSDEIKGPIGANLFIFHLPNEMTNWDLYLLFRRFGTILSVHTMIDKQTGLSRGYGFISFSTSQEAYNAKTNMNGFRLGKKRLKVQHKRELDNITGMNNSNSNSTSVYTPIGTTVYVPPPPPLPPSTSAQSFDDFEYNHFTDSTHGNYTDTTTNNNNNNDSNKKGYYHMGKCNTYTTHTPYNTNEYQPLLSETDIDDSSVYYNNNNNNNTQYTDITHDTTVNYTKSDNDTNIDQKLGQMKLEDTTGTTTAITSNNHICTCKYCGRCYRSTVTFIDNTHTQLKNENEKDNKYNEKSVTFQGSKEDVTDPTTTTKNTITDTHKSLMSDHHDISNCISTSQSQQKSIIYDIKHDNPICHHHHHSQIHYSSKYPSGQDLNNVKVMNQCDDNKKECNEENEYYLQDINDETNDYGNTDFHAINSKNPNENSILDTPYESTNMNN